MNFNVKLGPFKKTFINKMQTLRVKLNGYLSYLVN